MEEEVNKAINTTVFTEYGDPDYPKVTKAINFAQENVSAWCMLIRCSVRKDSAMRNICAILL